MVLASIVRLRSTAQGTCILLVLSLFDNYIYSHDRLLEALDTFCDKFFNLSVSGEKLRLGRILNAFEEDVHVKLVFLCFPENVPHKRDHLLVLTLDQELQVSSLLSWRLFSPDPFHNIVRVFF